MSANAFDLPDYRSIARAIRSRRMELGLTTHEVDSLAGLPRGYTAKVECWRPLTMVNKSKRMAKITWRAMGLVSLPLLCTALGLRLQFVRCDPPAHIREILANDIYEPGDPPPRKPPKPAKMVQ